MSRSYQSEEQEFFNDDYIVDNAFGQFVPRSKTDNPRRLNEEIQKVSNLHAMNPSNQMGQVGQMGQMGQMGQVGQMGAGMQGHHFNQMPGMHPMGQGQPMISEEEEL